MAEIKIRRKSRVGRWPLLLLLLLPVAWYVRQRAVRRHEAATAVVDTGTVPPPVALPPGTIIVPPARPPAPVSTTNATPASGKPAPAMAPKGSVAPARDASRPVPVAPAKRTP